MKSRPLINFSADRTAGKIHVVREFDAPAEMVWSAWTESELLDRWWAPKPWKAKTKFLDFKEGGSWLYAMTSPEGEKHWSVAGYKTIRPAEYLSFLESFCNEKGHINQNLPKSFWRNQFIDRNSSTTVRIEIVFDTLSDLEKVIEMGFEEGFSSALKNLDKILNTLTDG